MGQLKPISPQAVPAALEKARHYRLLNEPAQAESICRDILLVEPDHQEAQITLLLALTDQFQERPGESFAPAQQMAEGLTDDYSRAYYSGLVLERRGRADLQRGVPDAGRMAHSWLSRAMERYEEAERLRPPGNDDAVLRWNSCARTLESHPHVKPPRQDDFLPLLE